MPTRTGARPRQVAAVVAQAVLDQGQAADVAMLEPLSHIDDARDRALVRRLVHDLMRDWPMAQALIGALLSQPLRNKDRRVFFVLAIAVTELRVGREPDHAVVNSAVEATRLLPAVHLTKLVNAILRRCLRERATLDADLNDSESRQWGYPQWLIDALKRDWPHQWQDILASGNEAPPLTLRVNRRFWSREEALDAMIQAGIDAKPIEPLSSAIQCTTRVAIRDLPHFEEGSLSVQDASAQWTVDWLSLHSGLRVLDACAGPGGKAAHILEEADIELVCVESEPSRAEQVEAGFKRLGLSAELKVGDATAPDQWWDGQTYDRILIDAPCSAIGVIRRHPDIRWLRQSRDVGALTETQSALLEALWPLLKPGGILVYVTCSVLAEENHLQIEAFLERHNDAQPLKPPSNPIQPPGQALATGWQVLPGESGWDGFYFARIGRLPAH